MDLDPIAELIEQLEYHGWAALDDGTTIHVVETCGQYDLVSDGQVLATGSSIAEAVEYLPEGKL